MVTRAIAGSVWQRGHGDDDSSNEALDKRFSDVVRLYRKANRTAELYYERPDTSRLSGVKPDLI